MKLLIAAATRFEIAPFLQWLDQQKPVNVQVITCITGVGMTAAAFMLTKSILETKPDFVLQAGVAGAYNPETFSLGDLVLVKEEIFGDLGVDDHGAYQDIFDIALADGNKHPFKDKTLQNPLSGPAQKIALRQVTSLTINTVSGSTPLIAMRADKYRPDTESMEGAALHYVCLQMNVPFAQVRAISNYVEPRDKSKWQMGKAIENLNHWLTEFVNTL